MSNRLTPNWSHYNYDWNALNQFLEVRIDY